MFRPTSLRLGALLCLTSGMLCAAEPVAEVRATFDRHLRELAASHPERQITPEFPASEEEWLAHGQQVRAKLRDVFYFPKTSGPPESRVTGRIERGDFAIEKILYQSEPGNWVTALLYLPNGLDGKLPAIICPSGHGGSKSTPYNQYFAQMYAKAGCVVLVPDTIGEEERDERNRLGIRGHRIEHRVDRSLALGISVIGKMVHDIVRGIDYLVTRPEVDPDRIGCAGHSLGGTLTQYATAVDPRIKLSMPTAWTCNFQHIVGELSCCWRPFGILHAANDPELLALGAPHCAILMLGGEKDRTPMLPTNFRRVTEAQVRRVFELFGRGDAFSIHVTPAAGHHPFQLNRTALAWVERHFDLPRLTPGEIGNLPEGPPLDEVLMAELPAPFADKSWQTGRLTDAKAVWCDVRLLPAETLRCLQPGQEALPEYGMAGWMSARELELRVAFALPSTRPEWEKKRLLVVAGLKQTLGLPTASAPARARLVKRRAHGAVQVSEYEFGSLGLTSWLLRPAAAAETARLPLLIHLPARGIKQDTLDSEPAKEWLARGHAVLALDSVPFEETTHLLGTSATAFNTRHVIEALDAASQMPGVDASQISCLGEADDAALLAALLDPRIRQLTLPVILPSSPDRQSYRRNGIVPGLEALAPRDRLPALLAPRPLQVEDKAFDRKFIEAAYRLNGAAGAVQFADP